MKYFLSFLLTTFLFSEIFACSCEKGNFANYYKTADIVAIVTVTKKYGDYTDKSKLIELNYYKAELKFNKIYKGERFEELTALGSTTYTNSAGCEISLTVGNKYLIMLRKNADGKYYINACSAIFNINTQKSQSATIKHFDYIFDCFKKHKKALSEFEFANFGNYSSLIDESKFTKQDIKILKNKIAVYKVSIDNSNKITAINPIIKVGYKDKKIEKIIKEHFSIDNSLINYQTNTYLIYIDFSIYFI